MYVSAGTAAGSNLVILGCLPGRLLMMQIPCKTLFVSMGLISWEHEVAYQNHTPHPHPRAPESALDSTARISLEDELCLQTHPITVKTFGDGIKTALGH